MRIRAATMEDAPALSRILCVCYQGFGQTDGWPASLVAELVQERGTPACMGRMVESEETLVAETDGVIRGWVSIAGREITRLYVAPRWQRAGVGTRLFAAAEGRIRAQGHRTLFLGAAARSPVPFYQRMGMHVTGTRRIDCGPCRGMTSTVLEKDLGGEP